MRGADFPTTATTPGFTYHYDPQLGVFERSETLGPLFLERADTVGKGHFDVGFSYLYADLTDVGGIDFGERIQLGSQITALDEDGNPVDVAGAFLGNDFSLRHHVFSFAGTYGITNHWDVNLVLPLMYTILDLRGDAGVAIGPGTIATGPVSFNNFFSNDAFGVGDMLLRTKYRFLQSDVAFWGYSGTGIFTGQPPAPGLRAIAYLYPETVHIVVRKDSGISSVPDLRGKKVSLDEINSGTLADARRDEGT